MSSFRLADAYKLKSIAFPLISSGTNQFPKELALQVAMHSIVSFLTDHEMMVYLVVYDRNSYKIVLNYLIPSKLILMIIMRMSICWYAIRSLLQDFL